MKTIIVLSLAAVLFGACTPCGNLDCLVSDYAGQFKIVSTDQKNLLFGPDKRYSKDSVQFYSIDQADTTWFDFTAYPAGDYGLDSIISLNVYRKLDMLYISYSDGDIDTLNLSYNTYKSKCCGYITEVTGIRFNNKLELLKDRGTWLIEK